MERRDHQKFSLAVFAGIFWRGPRLRPKGSPKGPPTVSRSRKQLPRSHLHHLLTPCYLGKKICRDWGNHLQIRRTQHYRPNCKRKSVEMEKCHLQIRRAQYYRQKKKIHRQIHSDFLDRPTCRLLKKSMFHPDLAWWTSQKKQKISQNHRSSVSKNHVLSSDFAPKKTALQEKIANLCKP